MTQIILSLLPFLAVIAAAAIVARRLHTAPSIVLLAAGVGLALVPGLPRIELAPEFVLLVILPPVIYTAGVSMSWREFRSNLRPIVLLAFGAVVFTTCAIAAAVHYVLGLDWTTGFVLGAIVAPPDVVAPLAIARRLGIPRRLSVVLEGEGLANDATALILYRFAVIAVATGNFSLVQATETFALIVGGEIIYGIAIGWISLRLRRWARDPHVEITLSLMTPYAAYWLPEHFGGSGVLATVAAGLYVSWRGPLLISSATRLQGVFFWDLVIYLIEGFVFLVTGLQARTLIETAQDLPFRTIIVATLLTAAIAILARFVWVFPVTYLPHLFLRSRRGAEVAPSWQTVFVLSFTGVRGIVSLAAALALPLTTESGAAFPHRELILFVTFGVVILTLVGLGSTLPLIVRALGLGRLRDAELHDEQAAERAARRRTAEHANQRIDALLQAHDLSPDVLTLIKSRYQSRLDLLSSAMEDTAIEARLQLRMALIEEERVILHDMLQRGEITDESRRRIEHELDLEEAGFRNRSAESSQANTRL